jgi:hypothetical protein
MTTPRKTTKKTTTRLKRSKLENLFRHANGVYWVCAKVNGKSVERSLRTADCNLAATLLAEILRELKGASEARNADTLAVDIQAEADRDDPVLKPASRHYYRQLAKSIIDTLPAPIARKRLPQVSVGDLRAWRAIYAAILPANCLRVISMTVSNWSSAGRKEVCMHALWKLLSEDANGLDSSNAACYAGV